MESKTLDQITSVEELQRALEERYFQSLGIEPAPRFQGGEIVTVIPPRQVHRDGIMVLGAYPTAEFKTINRHRVPVGNIREPFDPATASGKELDDHCLVPLRISRSQCWITNLLKVFLFKSDHVRPASEDDHQLVRDDFERLASSTANMQWLAAELRIASPRVIITLGREVAGIIRGVNGDRLRNGLLNGRIEEREFAGTLYRWVHLPHPGIVMRTGSTVNPWPALHECFCQALAGPIHAILTSYR